MPRYMFRPLTRNDEGELVAFHERCSEQTHYLRFFCAKPHLRSMEAKYLCDVDQQARGALVVTDLDDPDTIHGVGRWEPAGDEAAEVAFVLEDSYQGGGIGRALVGAILSDARGAGYLKATADVLAQNRRMRVLLTHAGYRYTERLDGCGAVALVLDLAEPREVAKLVSSNMV